MENTQLLHVDHRVEEKELLFEVSEAFLEFMVLLGIRLADIELVVFVGLDLGVVGPRKGLVEPTLLLVYQILI